MTFSTKKILHDFQCIFPYMTFRQHDFQSSLWARAGLIPWPLRVACEAKVKDEDEDEDDAF